MAKATILLVRGQGASVCAVARVGCVDVSSYWNHWPCLFPQHGPGRKHERRIQLTGWQQRIVDAHPRRFLRGLIHSDGCRVTNRVWAGKYAYPRYSFTNNSGEILQLLRSACDAIGVPHRDSKWNTVSIARREGVAALDAFIGPKR